MTASDQVSVARNLRGWLGIYVRGIAMGIAELVPGVSGGTIAFVTGIYRELVGALASFRPAAFATLLGKRPAARIRAFWRRHNLTFLSVLGIGMLSGIAALANALSVWLAQARPVVWGFFFGVIALSIVQLARTTPLRAVLTFAPLGLIVGFFLVQLDPLGVDKQLWVFFLGGAVAISAWLLPAVSGSFVLLVLGLYEDVLRAVTQLEWPVLITFFCGCAVGLLLFANALAWLFRHHASPVVGFLTGFMAGSIIRLWPWQADGAYLDPAAYAAATQANAFVVAVLLAAAAGALCIWLLARLK